MNFNFTLSEDIYSNSYREFKEICRPYKLSNKKPGQDAGVFRISSLSKTPVVPYFPCAYLLLFFSGTSYSPCPHHKKSQPGRIGAKDRN